MLPACRNGSAGRFDNLGVLDIPGPVLEETHYYPFGLTMSGISTTAPLRLEGKRKFNGIEFNHKEFSDGSGLDLYTAKFRGLDPQIGRFIEIDPKIESAESWSPYSVMLNNPIKNIDPLGDSTIPGGGFLRNFWEGIKDGGKSTVNFIKSLGTANGWGNFLDGLAVMSPFNIDNRSINARASMIDGTVKYIKNVPSMTKDQVGHDLGYGTEKAGEILILSKSPSIIGTGLGWANKTLATKYLSFVGQIDNFETIEGFTFKSGSNDFIYHNSLEAASYTRWSTPTLFSDSKSAFNALGLDYPGSSNIAQYRFNVNNIGFFVKGTAAPQGLSLRQGLQLYRTPLGFNMNIKLLSW